jgi:putative flippase GtrA
MRSPAIFLVVGLAATALHLAIVALLVESGAMGPAPANVFGFAGAWVLSYVGHARWTFRSTRAHREALPRFLAVSLLGLALGQGVYMLLLRLDTQHYLVWLGLTQAVVALGTYLLGRRWAFRPPPP